MSQAYETGPVHAYVGASATSILTLPTKAETFYAGSGEIAPDIIKQTKYDPVFNDIAGSLPYDYLFQGEECIVPMNFTVFNWGRMTDLNSAINNTNPGFDYAYDVGTLMLTEAKAFHLFLQFPYYTYKASVFVNSSGDMPAGYHFYGTFVDSYVVQPGTKANKIRINFRCVRVYQPASTGNGFYLFNHSMALFDGTIPTVPPNNKTGVIS